MKLKHFFTRPPSLMVEFEHEGNTYEGSWPIPHGKSTKEIEKFFKQTAKAFNREMKDPEFKPI